MNTIGKILVVLNFLFAVIVGIFLVMDIAMRTQWKQAYHDLKKDTEVLKLSRQSHMDLNTKLANDIKAANAAKDKAIQDAGDAQSKMNANIGIFDIKVKAAENAALEAQQTTQISQKTQERMAKEIAGLNKTIAEREVQIVKLQADVHAISNTARNFEQLASAAKLRNINLEEQLREITRELTERKAGINPDTITIRNPNDPNPPSVQVNGKIERIDESDSTLIQLSVGTDHGVNKHHTLDVYRTRPDAKYLGMVRIVEAYHQKSVARLITTGSAANRPQLRVDDMVTSKITK
jgi:hypothetical protein